MPGTRKPYPAEFRQQIIELARASRSIPELAAEFEPSGETIRKWLIQADRDDSRHTDGLSSVEREEIIRQKRGSSAAAGT